MQNQEEINKFWKNHDRKERIMFFLFPWMRKQKELHEALDGVYNELYELRGK